MSAIDSKYHIKIGDFGFLLARQARTERHIYTREEAPQFVNKFSSGDPNYRDATFFPHWAQLNWQNGFDQEFFDDGGRFFRSSGIDTTTQEKLTLQKAFNSAGTLTNSPTAFGLRSASASNWWDANYDYRQKLTITAPAGVDVPVGHPVQITIDTDALETAGKLQADRDDWKVIYDNGSTQTTLKRDFITDTLTVFATQAAISGGGTDNNYYVYYGYASESSNDQPTTDAEWNEVYGMYGGAAGETVDANTLAIWHGIDGSGTTITDTDSTNDLTGTATLTWGTDGLFGRHFTQASGGGETTSPGITSSNMDVGSFTVEFWAKRQGSDWNLNINHGRDSDGPSVKFKIQSNGGGGRKIYFEKRTAASTSQSVTTTNDIYANDTNWHQYAITFDGTSTAKFYRDGSLIETQTFSGTPGIRSVSGRFRPTGDTSGSAAEYFSNYRISNTARTSFPHALSSEPTITSDGEVAQASLASGGIFEVYAGDSNGLVYLWDGTSSFSEVFDTRRLAWYDDTATNDGDALVGDDAGTEKARAQGFQLGYDTFVKGVQLYLKKNAGTPGDITVRIETNNAGVPSGTLADANLTTTISSFATTSYGWVEATFSTAATLSASTQYWIVVKTAAGANDNNYAWGTDTSSPSYSDGTGASSTDGGSTWTAQAGDDSLFRVLGEDTQVNKIVQATFSATPKLWFATGDPTSTNAGNARLYTYDGTDWALAYTFTGDTGAAALSMQVYNSKLYVGLSPTASIQVSSDGTTFTESKDIDNPDNPGYPWDMAVYNGRLYVAGGHPEYTITNDSLGFLWSFDGFAWSFTYDFSFTVIKSLQVFDGLMFIGTINKRLYVFNTASVDKLFEFPWDVSIDWMDVWDDKLAVGLGGTDGLTGQEAVYLFDRNGFHKAFTPSSQGVTSGIVVRNQMLVGNTGTTVNIVATNTYQASGTLQSSYFEAQLPNIPKLYRSVTLMFDALPAGTSIQVEYKTDESGSWTSLGTASTEGSTEEEFFFGTGVYSNKLSLRYTLSTGVNTSTPTLRKSIMKYVLSPDFKYLWKMKLACADNVMWLDETEPIAILGSDISANDTTITMKSTHNSTPTSGFPDPNGSTMYAVVEDEDGTEDVFTYTGKTDTTLTGIPSSGTYALSAHTATDNVKVRVRGADLHQLLLDLKQTRQLFTLTDIDGLTYTVFFHSYQSDNWVINPDDVGGGMENEVPITLLEA